MNSIAACKKPLENPGFDDEGDAAVPAPGKVNSTRFPRKLSVPCTACASASSSTYECPFVLITGTGWLDWPLRTNVRFELAFEFWLWSWLAFWLWVASCESAIKGPKRNDAAIRHKMDFLLIMAALLPIDCWKQFRHWPGAEFGRGCMAMATSAPIRIAGKS